MAEKRLKPQKNTVFARITPDLRLRLEKLALLKRRTMSELIWFALEQYIAQEERVTK
jgi:predicted transcriptional regulator